MPSRVRVERLELLRAVVTSRDEKKIVLGWGGGSPGCTEKDTESRVCGNHLDRLVLIVDGLLPFCKGLLQLHNGLTLSGNLQILLCVLLKWGIPKKSNKNAAQRR